MLALAVTALLSGCSTAAPADVAESPAASRAATASPTPSAAPDAAPDVPVVAATLPPVTAAIAPSRVRIPSRDIDVPVDPVGVQDDGLMELPANPARAGWYRFGPDLAARQGSVVIAAHVDSLQYGLGPFVGLRDLRSGAEVVVTDEEGRTVRYTVDRVRHVQKAKLPVEGLFTRDGAPRLVLITCGGTFDRTTRTYSDNIIVTAKAST